MVKGGEKSVFGFSSNIYAEATNRSARRRSHFLRKGKLYIDECWGDRSLRLFKLAIVKLLLVILRFQNVYIGRHER
ncbi:hypothetical protein L2E82_31660 [Cichorium intybus]|uniref:Uncharacterized protein n=1 Tax=Cichorium intybus TaxID=13427 RepID=A0ACB9BFG1_CICIN|nr:hypothetical protein L2E82_31660 [Cichorium intybus]